MLLRLLFVRLSGLLRRLLLVAGRSWRLLLLLLGFYRPLSCTGRQLGCVVVGVLHHALEQRLALRGGGGEGGGDAIAHPTAGEHHLTAH